MIKVLIVDDELIVRVGIRSMLDWKQNGFEIVGEAADGEDALLLIKELMPDIVLTDIKMRRMDGITLLQKIKERGYEIKTIILSCYNEFEIVRETMKAGASDYILKLSMNPQDLLEVMVNVKNQLLSERTDKNVPYGITGVDHKTWKIAVRSGIFGQSQPDNAPPADYGLESECFVTLVSRIYRIQSNGCSTKNQKGLNISALNFIRDVISDNFECDTFFLEDKDLVCVVRFGSVPEQVQYDCLSRSVTRFQNLIETCLNCITITGFQNRSSDLAGLKDCCSQTSLAARHGFYAQQSGIIDPADVHYQLVSKDVIDYDHLKMLYDKLRTNDILAVERDLTDIFDRIETHKSMDPAEVIKTAKVIFNIFFTCLWHTFQQETEPGGTQMSSLNDIEQAENFDQLRHMVLSGLQLFRRYKQQSVQGFYRREIQKLIDHIAEFPDERMTLDQAAANVNLSKNYFCSIFKAETGETFNDYLTSQKIKMAQDLLKNTNLSINEIAVRTGYDNINYFFTLFRKNTGISPQKFRRSDPS